MLLKELSKMAFEAIAIIVAGGLGTRARAMTGENLPKALLPVAGVPIIERQIRTLAEQGFSKIVILAGHLGHLIEEFIQENMFLKRLEITVHVEASALGTAGAVISAREYLDAEQLLVIFGDLLFDLDFSKLIKKHQDSRAAATIVCRPNDHPKESDLVETDDQSKIIQLLPKKRPEGNHRNLVPTGIYVISRSQLLEFPVNQNLDFFRDYFPKLLGKGMTVHADTSAPYICDVGTLSGRNAAEQDLISGRVQRMRTGVKRPTVFFDVDGVLNEDIPGIGITSPNQIQLIPGVGQSLRRLNQMGYLAIGITNRPQLAKGQITREELEKIFSRLEMRLSEEKGYLDKIYFCPHHPESGHVGEIAALKVVCDCRKPEAGLITCAMRDLPIDLNQAVMIGDTWRDIKAAKIKGIYAYGVRTGSGCREMPADIRPDLMFHSVVDAVDFCVNYKKNAEVVLQHLDLSRLPNRRYLIGIAGVSQSGKSSLAHAMERVLKDQGRPVLRVTLDDWIMPAKDRLNANVYVRTRAGSFGSIYKALKAGKTVSTNRYDAFTRTAGKRISYLAPENALIIVEGVLACTSPAINELDYSIFIDMPNDLASQRQQKLLAWKNLGFAEIESLMKERSGDELSSILTQRRNVNVILNGESLTS